MQSILEHSDPDAVWWQVEPLLEGAMSRLNEKERILLALRFFENRTITETAALLGVGEWAARKRGERALGKLRNYFAKRGVNSTTSAIAQSISVNSIQVAPVALAKTVTAVALAKGATAPISTLTLIKGALKIMAWTKAKTAIVAAAAVIVATGTTTVVVRHEQRALPKPRPVAPAETDFAKNSWTYAGYADPRSALLSAVWFDSKGDLEKFLASLTPGERERQLQMYQGLAQKTGKSLTACFNIVSTEGLNKAGGFDVLDQQIIADDQVILHVSFHGIQPGEKTETVKVVDAKMIKIGNEWKVDSIGPK